MPGTLCGECENVNEIPQYETIINEHGEKEVWQVCRYCEAGMRNISDVFKEKNKNL